jgi:hypothetical protein
MRRSQWVLVGVVSCALVSPLFPPIPAGAAQAKLSIGDASVTEGDSGTATATFKVKLRRPNATDVSASFATSDGSAIAGSDYKAKSGQVVIPAGATVVKIKIKIVSDTTFESHEDFAVDLTDVIGALVIDAHAVGTITDNDGDKDFWLTFPGNYSNPTASQPLAVITGANGTTGTATGSAFSLPFTIGAAGIVYLNIPNSAEVQSSDLVESRSVHITATGSLGVAGVNQQLHGVGEYSYTGGGFLARPTGSLGTEHLVLAYQGIAAIPTSSQLTVVAAFDGTTVTITPKATVGTHPAGVAFTVAMDQGDTYQLRTPADLSGSEVDSDKPIAVYGGAECANVPTGTSYCDLVVEQMPPLYSWGTEFYSLPFARRTNGDTFRVLASVDGTVVNVNGSTLVTLNRGQFYEWVVTARSQITTSQPALVAQFFNGVTWDGGTVGDPMMVLVPPTSAYRSSYAFGSYIEPEGGVGAHANVIAPTADVGSVLLDGVAIPPASFTAIGATSYSGAVVALTDGRHTLSGPSPLGGVVYSFSQYNAQGYPIG